MMTYGNCYLGSPTSFPPVRVEENPGNEVVITNQLTDGRYFFAFFRGDKSDGELTSASRSPT